MDYIELIKLLRTRVNEIEEDSMFIEHYAKEYSILKNQLIPIVHQLTKMQFSKQKENEV